jgi:hypothetical protein
MALERGTRWCRAVRAYDERPLSAAPCSSPSALGGALRDSLDIRGVISSFADLLA